MWRWNGPNREDVDSGEVECAHWGPFLPADRNQNAVSEVSLLLLKCTGRLQGTAPTTGSPQREMHPAQLRPDCRL